MRCVSGGPQVLRIRTNPPGSVVAADVTLEAELAWVMSAWGGLSSDTRTAILSIVASAQGR